MQVWRLTGIRNALVESTLRHGIGYETLYVDDCGSGILPQENTYQSC